MAEIRSRAGRIPVPLVWLVVGVLVAAAPWLGLTGQWQRQIALVLLLALLVSGTNLTFGWAGELNLGVPAMYAAGAYAAGYLYVHQINDVLLGLLCGILASVVVGTVAGLPGLRLGGWMLAIASFYLVLLIPPILQLIPTEVLGGYSGLIGIPAPEMFGSPLGRSGFYVVVVLVTLGWFAVYRNLVLSRFGDALLTLHETQALAPSLGLSRYRLKLTTYALGAVPAGLAGTMFASLDRFVGAESFSLDLIVLVLAASIIAGRRSIYAILPATVLLEVIEVNSVVFEEYGTVVFGLFLIAGGILFRQGIAGLVRRLRGDRQKPSPGGQAEPARAPASEEHARFQFGTIEGRPLRVRGVTKSFGGAHVLRGVEFEAAPGRITAVVGPNGSGKTTMLNIVSGFHAPTGGEILLGEERLSGRSAVHIARRGVARTFQSPAIPTSLSARRAVATALVAAHPVSLVQTILRTPGYRRVRREELREAGEVLAALGLAEIVDSPASTLALGTRRMTELARALVRRPTVLLLDEVASGLDLHEVEELAEVLRAVRAAGATVVIVEHNFALVRVLADSVVVLADGQAIAQGSPEDILADREVTRRFLGDAADITGTSIRAEAQTS